MSTSGAISVVTVVKNDASHLEETILNVIEKKAKIEIDFIVIDGGSTDGTTEIITKYSDHISYWVSEEDNGIYDAMNKGWAVAAENSFILFLGAGDKIISLPDSLNSYLYDDVIFGSVVMGKKAIFTSRADFHLCLYNSLHHQALLVNKAHHPAAPFNTQYKIYADFDFNQRLKKSGAHFVHSIDFIGYARPGGVSDKRHFTESLNIVNKNFGLLWVILALLSYSATKIFPFLNRLQPIQNV